MGRTEDEGRPFGQNLQLPGDAHHQAAAAIVAMAAAALVQGSDARLAAEQNPKGGAKPPHLLLAGAEEEVQAQVLGEHLHPVSELGRADDRGDAQRRLQALESPLRQPFKPMARARILSARLQHRERE